MAKYCLLLACAAAFSFTFALRAEPPVQHAEAAQQKTPAPPNEPKITFNSVHVDGPYVAEHQEIVATAAKEGHEIGNHSWSHPNFGKMSQESVRSQVQRTDDAIKSATGKRPTLLRPPYGSITEREKRWIHDEFGYDIILWDVDPLDWKRPGPAVVRSRILKETRPGSIVLSHDIHPGTIEAMPSTFDELEAKGFKFVTVSELIDMATPVTPRPSPQSGKKAPPKAIPATSVAPPPSPTSSPSG